MTVAGLNQQDFLDCLKENGYEVLSDKYWELESVNRIVMGKEGHTFVIHLKSFYFYVEVMNKFLSLEIKKIPDSCKEDYDHCATAYNQHLEQKLKWLQNKLSEAVEKKENNKNSSSS